MALRSVTLKIKEDKTCNFSFQKQTARNIEGRVFFSSPVGNRRSGTSPSPPTMPENQLACSKTGADFFYKLELLLFF